jgi:hypothetical protein
LVAVAFVTVMTASMALAGGSTALAHKGGHDSDAAPGCSEWGGSLASFANAAGGKIFSDFVTEQAHLDGAGDYVAFVHSQIC